MSRTADQLVREVASRFGPEGIGYFLTGTAPTGSATTFVDQTLLQYLPVDNAQVNAWIYCPTAGGPAGNRGLERRIKSWTYSNFTAVLYGPGFPSTPDTGPYEINTRIPRRRILEAVNSGVRQLGLLWYREFVDESLVTVDQQWRYVLPAAQNWARLKSVDIQINTDTTSVGYPYASADAWGWREYLTVSGTTGVQIRYLQFSTLPPAGRILRLTGEGLFPDLSADADILALEPKWEQAATEWIYDWALYRLNQWASNPTTPSAESDKLRVKEMDLLNASREMVKNLIQEHTGGRIITPWNGYGRYQGASDDPAYFGAFSNSH